MLVNACMHAFMQVCLYMGRPYSYHCGVHKALVLLELVKNEYKCLPSVIVQKSGFQLLSPCTINVRGMGNTLALYFIVLACKIVSKN